MAGTSVVVVGAGILGAAIASELHTRDKSCHVMVLEAGVAPCQGATGSSWAWINANQKTPRWYQDMNHQGMLAWREGILTQIHLRNP